MHDTATVTVRSRALVSTRSTKLEPPSGPSGAMVSLPACERQNIELRPLSPIFELTTTSSSPSTGEEALLRPGSSFQASHQDVLNHLKASAVSLRTQKIVPQPLYQIPKE